jgi:hypothetical protein
MGGGVDVRVTPNIRTASTPPPTPSLQGEGENVAPTHQRVYSITAPSRTFARTATRGGRRISSSNSSAGSVVQIIST